MDQQLMVDIDLSILGRSTDEYDEFELAIREEYQWVPWPTYCEKRIEVLQSFLQRPQIYSIERFAEFESNARANLTRAIQQLAESSPSMT